MIEFVSRDGPQTKLEAFKQVDEFLSVNELNWRNSVP